MLSFKEAYTKLRFIGLFTKVYAIGYQSCIQLN
jgi:hypothetical protein